MGTNKIHHHQNDNLGLTLAYFLDSFSWFPITRDQITMLLDGNTCDSSDYFKQFDIDPIEFSVDNLGYLSGL